jgi:hypothetical protein
MSKQITPKVPWTAQNYLDHIARVEEDIAEWNRKINKNDKRLSEHREIRKQLVRQIGKKWEYHKTLLQNIKQYFPEAMTEEMERHLRNILKREQDNSVNGLK